MIRKRLCVLICFMMALNCAIFPTTAVADDATAVVGENLLTNGGLEDVVVNSPMNWNTYPDKWGKSCIKLEQENVYSGKYAARIDGYEGKTSTSIIMQAVSGLVPMATYRLSFRAYLTGASSLAVNLTYPSEGIERGFTAFSGPEGEWTLVERDITLNEQSTTIKIQFKGTADEYVILDDISFSLVKMPAKYHLELKDIFNYSDSETGMASLELFDYYLTDEEIAATTVNFSITNSSGTVIESKDNVSVNSEGKAEFVYDTSNMYVKKNYTLNATVYYDGVEAETLSKNVYRYKRPSRLTADGTYMLDGEPFIPVIAYGVQEADYPYLKEIGVNTVYLIGYDLNSLQPKLQLCRDYGMKVIIDIGGHLKWSDPAYTDVYMTWAEQMVQGTKDDSVILGYAQMDEPDLDDDTLALLERCYKMIRTNAPDHPIYLCQYNQNDDVYVTMGKYCDILLEDNYPYNDDNSGKSTFVNRAIEQSGKPVYSVLQTFNGMGYFPTADHIRGQMYRALEEGAKGIAFYAITESNGTPLWATDRWEGLKNMASDEMPHIFDYYILDKYSGINAIDEGIPYGFYCDGWYVDDTLYLVVHNRSNSAIEREISLSDCVGKTVGYCNVLRVNDGTSYSDFLDKMTVSLAAQEVALYKINRLNTDGFGPHADFEYIDRGYVSENTYGKLQAGYGTSHFTKIKQGTVKADGSADEPQTYVSLDANGTAAESYVQMRSRVEEGKNYVISFDSKTSNPRDLMVQIEYYVVASNGWGYSNWIDSTVHVHEDGSEIRPYKMRLLDSHSVYTNHNVNGSGTYDWGRYPEGFQRMWIGSDSATDWTTNQIEIHVPCHAHSVEVTVTRNHTEYASNDGYIAPCVDNFKIEEVDANLVVNGDFEKSSSYSAATQVMDRDGLYSSGKYPTGWVGQRGYIAADTSNGHGVIEQVTENGNTYYKATAVSSGMEFVQGVWLKEGTYKLSFKWRIFDNKNTSDDYKVLASLRRGTQNIPEIPAYTEIGSTTNIEWGMTSSGYGIKGENYAPYGSTFEPTIGMGADQSEEDGWVNYEVYFDITDARAYWLAFGCNRNFGTYGIDDVVLEEVSDATELRCVSEAIAVCEDMESYERNIINPANGETTATVSNKKMYAVYKTAEVGTAREMSGMVTLINPATDIEGAVVTAVYEENIFTGETSLYAVDWSEFSAKAGEISLAAAKKPVSVPADTEDGLFYSAKAFLWTSDGLVPLLPAVSE